MAGRNKNTEAQAKANSPGSYKNECMQITLFCRENGTQ